MSPADHACGARPWPLRPADETAVETLAAELELPPVVARILAARGITAVDACRDFLNPSLEHLHDPMLMPGMEAATERLIRACSLGRRVLVYGDYDVDGVCGVVMLARALASLGALVEQYIPHRLEEGYGLHTAVLEQAAAGGVDLVVTVDTGITALDAARRAGELGLDLVITDHHTPPEMLPQAAAVVHPRLPGSRYPWGQLAGSGVALKVLQALAAALGRPDNWWCEHLDLAALATVADVVPLLDENRVMVTHGLAQLRRQPRPGLAALCRAARVEPAELSTWEVSFLLAPRLNAAGRTGDAGLAVRLLEAGEEEAPALAERLEAENRSRQTLQENILKEARRRLTSSAAAAVTPQAGEDAPPAGEDPAVAGVVLLADPGWHPGVLGVVAARLAEEIGVPVLLARDEGGLWRGSARSVPGFDVTAALRECGDLLVEFGGHGAAAGFALHPQCAGALEQALSARWQAARAAGAGRRKVQADAVVPAGAVDEGLVSALDRLAPFGEGNPPPLLASRLSLRQARTVGRGGSHLKLSLDAGLEAIGFRLGDRLAQVSGAAEVEVLYIPLINTWQGRRRVQLRLEDLAPAAAARPSTARPPGVQPAAAARPSAAGPRGVQPAAAAGTGPGARRPALAPGTAPGTAGVGLHTLDRSVLVGLYRMIRRLAGDRGGLFTWDDLVAQARQLPSAPDPRSLHLGLRVFAELDLVQTAAGGRQGVTWRLADPAVAQVKLEDSPTFRAAAGLENP